jgi:hypothetical protein
MLQRNYHTPAAGRSYMTHRQTLQDFPDTSQISLLENSKIDLIVSGENAVPVHTLSAV